MRLRSCACCMGRGNGPRSFGCDALCRLTAIECVVVAGVVGYFIVIACGCCGLVCGWGRVEKALEFGSEVGVEFDWLIVICEWARFGAE